MALLQTVLTSWLNSGNSVTIVTTSGQAVYGVVTDDGSNLGDDSIIVDGEAGTRTVVPKAAIAWVGNA